MSFWEAECQASYTGLGAGDGDSADCVSSQYLIINCYDETVMALTTWQLGTLSNPFRRAVEHNVPDRHIHRKSTFALLIPLSEPKKSLYKHSNKARSLVFNPCSQSAISGWHFYNQNLSNNWIISRHLYFNIAAIQEVIQNRLKDQPV